MTPESLQYLFDGNAIILLFAWGLVVKYVPFMAKVPNALIPWGNTILYVAGRLAVPPAHADTAGAVSAIPDAVCLILGGFTSSIWARQLYEGFGRGLLEKLLKIKKAV